MTVPPGARRAPIVAAGMIRTSQTSMQREMAEAPFAKERGEWPATLAVFAIGLILIVAWLA